MSDELNRLRAENEALNDQIKGLVRTEKELYNTQRERDRQLRNIQSLGKFALDVAIVGRDHEQENAIGSLEDDILELAECCLRKTFDYQKFTILFSRSFPSSATKSESTPILGKSVPRYEFWKRLSGVTVLSVDEGDDFEDHRNVIESMHMFLQLRVEDIRAWAIIPIKVDQQVALYILLISEHGHRPNFHLEPITKRQSALLQVLASHVERALENKRLLHDLSRQRTELRNSNQKLEESLAELKKTQNKFLQTTKMEAIGKLAGGVAHDFNNILTVIMCHGAFLLEELENTESKTEIDGLMAAADRASQLTSQLLAFSRRQERKVEVLNANELISGMDRMLRRLVGEDLHFEVVLSAAPIFVRVDRSQLEQVLMNLIVNARDATPSGGTIVVQAESLSVSQDQQQMDLLRLSVRDTGHGMDETTQRRVFEPFFTTKSVGEGTGMGLAMVYGIVEQNGGAIELHSAPGEGSSFEVTFPQVDPQADVENGSEKKTGILKGSETILLVEDEFAIQKIARRALERSGYRVVCAPNGLEALSLLEKNDASIDLLLTDVVMPEIGGVELAARFYEYYPDCSVLYISGYASDTLETHGLESRPENYLQKPFTPAKLLEAVRRVLDNQEPTGPC